MFRQIHLQAADKKEMQFIAIYRNPLNPIVRLSSDLKFEEDQIFDY